MRGRGVISGFGALLASALLLVILAAAPNAAVTHAMAPDDQAVAYQANAAHTGAVSGAGVAPPLVQAWSVSSPDPITSYPLIVNGVVYIVRTNQTNDGSRLEARSQATGALLWSKTSGYGFQGPAYDRGRVFVVDNSGQLTAYEADTGAMAWSRDPPFRQGYNSALTAIGGRVYVSGYLGLNAVREHDGSLAWLARVAGETPAVTVDSAFLSSRCHHHEAVTLIGTARWTHSTDCTGGGATTPVVANGLVWAREYAELRPPILLDAATGANVGAFTSETPPAVTPTASYLVDGTTLTAIGPTGAGPPAWTFTSAKPLTAAPLAVDGTVFIGDKDGLLSAVQGGTSVWSAQVGTGFGPADSIYEQQHGLAAANGTLVAPSGTTLTAFRPSATVGTKPVNTTAPSITGALRASERLVADVGAWSGLPTGYAYGWQRCDAAGANCTDIPSATGPVHMPGAADAGHRFRVTVTATNAPGSASAAALSDALAAPLAPPENTSLPEISGTPQMGETLTATAGSWANSPDTLSYQWYRCYADECTDIYQATDPTYTVTTYDAGRDVGVDVIAVNAAGTSTVSALAGSVPDFPPALIDGEDPVISGTPRVGETLRVSTGSWFRSPTSYSYVWGRCDESRADCSEVRAESTSPDYTVQQADVGQYLVALVFASNSGGTGEPGFAAIGPVFSLTTDEPPQPVTPITPPTPRPSFASPYRPLRITPPPPPPTAPLKLDLDTSQMPKRLRLKSVCPVDKRGRPRAGAVSGTYELSASAASTQVKLSADLPAANGKPKTTMPLAARTTKRVDPFSEDLEVPIDRKRCALLRRAFARTGKATLVLSLSLAPMEADVAAENRTLRIPLSR